MSINEADSVTYSTKSLLSSSLVYYLIQNRAEIEKIINVSRIFAWSNIMQITLNVTTIVNPNRRVSLASIQFELLWFFLLI